MKATWHGTICIHNKLSKCIKRLRVRCGWSNIRILNRIFLFAMNMVLSPRMRYIKNCLKKSYEKCQFLIWGKGTWILRHFSQEEWIFKWKKKNRFNKLTKLATKLNYKVWKIFQSFHSTYYVICLCSSYPLFTHSIGYELIMTSQLVTSL